MLFNPLLTALLNGLCTSSLLCIANRLQQIWPGSETTVLCVATISMSKTSSNIDHVIQSNTFFRHAHLEEPEFAVDLCRAHWRRGTHSLRNTCLRFLLTAQFEAKIAAAQQTRLVEETWVLNDVRKWRTRELDNQMTSDCRAASTTRYDVRSGERIFGLYTFDTLSKTSTRTGRQA